MNEPIDISRIAVIDAQIEALSAERDDIIQRWADANCPYKVGDTATIMGYSHKGKKCIIDMIRGKRSYRRDGGLYWSVFGYVLKNDGMVGLNRVEWDQGDEERSK